MTKSTKTRKPSQVLTFQDRRRFSIVRAGLFFISALAASAIIALEFPSAVDQSYSIGEPAPRSFFSPLTFSFVNEPATEVIRQQKAKEIPSVYELHPEITAEAQNKIATFFQQMSPAGLPPDPQSVAPQPLTLPISEEVLKALQVEGALQEAQKALGLLQEKMASNGVLPSEKKQQLISSTASHVLTINRESKEEKIVAVEDLQAAGKWENVFEKTVPGDLLKNRELKAAIVEIADLVLIPNLTENEHETAVRRKKELAAVEPVMIQVKKDQLIIQRGILVTPEAHERFDQIQKRMQKHKAVNKFVAIGILVGLIYLLVFFYLNFFDRKVFHSLPTILMILGVYLLNLFIGKVVALAPGPTYYLMPMALSSVLLALLIGPRLGLLSAAVMAMLAAPMANFFPEIILMTMVGGIAGTYASLQLRKRIQFLRLGAAIGLSSFFVLLAFQLIRETPFVEAFQTSAFGLAMGLLVTMPLCFLLLPILEWIFNLTTDITLLELSDLNHPLLKRMVLEAPGTYHHSLVVSTLAEAACESIGANALLARVGCYFHDIGKIAQAEFFTENSRQQNRHEKLTPTMSCLVIMNHVKDGLELGRKHKLRAPILKFIPEHQGTGVIYYFYRKAIDQAKPGERIDREDFRYPGPKPQSRETAIALLADSVEASSRSLKEPSPESIRQLVRKIINDKFIDGQLEECDLTLRDLHKIQESFVRDLMAIFHTRVQYPIATEDDSYKPDLFEEGQFAKFRIDSLKHPE